MSGAVPRMAVLFACLASAIAMAQSQAPTVAPAAGTATAAATPAPAGTAQADAAPDAPATDTPAGVEPAAPPVAAPPLKLPTRYTDLRRVRAIDGDAVAGKAKSEVCAACHGPQGIAIAPIFPNLAGQHLDFLYWQLVEFKRGTRVDSPMTALAADLTDADMRDLAAYYAAMPATPMATAGDAGAAPAAAAPDATAPDATAPVDAALIAQGQQLFLHGDPVKGIPACQGCHGPQAQGHLDARVPDRSGYVPYAAFPALRGQPGAYLQAKLGEYRGGTVMHDSTTDFIMNGVGRRLDDDSINALSAWLSTPPPAH